MSDNELLTTALSYAKAGLSVIPCDREGKSPEGITAWKPYEKRIADQATIRNWFSRPDVDALAVIGGDVSGNLETIDHDEPALLMPWCDLVEDLAPGLLSRLIIRKTQGSKRHFVYRCAVIEGNTKLAKKWIMGDNGKPKKETLIETRGEGGITLVEPTLGYELLQGDMTAIPVITPDERTILLNAARSLNLATDENKPGQTTEARTNETGGLRPGDDFNERGEALPILERHGWRAVSRRGDVVHLRRPGKDQGSCSATWNHIPDRLYVFSTNAYPFESEEVYTPFAVYTILEHDGDYTAAARDLAAQGYGTDGRSAAQRQKRRPIGERIPGYQAEQIKTLAPTPPDPDFRKRILAALRELASDGKKRLPADIRRENAGRLLLTWLAQHGGFVQTPGDDRFYFYRPERRLYNLESDRWAAWLYAATGANPAGTDYAHLAADCKTAAMAAPQREVVRVAAWDDEAQVLRVSRFDGTVYKLDGAEIREEANGEAVLFNDDPMWTPYRPDFDGTGTLRKYTTELPNWPTDTEEMYGLALRVWELSTYFTELCPTRPMAVKIGEKGSGKTMTWRLFLRFLLGPFAEVSGTPDKPDGFTAAAAATHVLVLDNLDDFRGWLRDKLARLSTGAVDEYRRLYTSNEVGRVRYRCWLAFTSRTPDTLRRDDLADRLLLLPVERIESDALRAERDFLHQATQDRDKWWGDVLTILNTTVTAIRRGELEGKSTLRMADWESLGRLIAKAENAGEEWTAFVEQLGKAQADFLLEGDLIVEGLNLWMDQKDGQGIEVNHGREVTAKMLHQDLTGLLFGDKKPSSDWPKSAVGFGRRLASIRRELGTLWKVEWGKGTTTKTLHRNVYQFWPRGSGQLELPDSSPVEKGEIPL